MTIFISQGRYTHPAFHNMIETPEDCWDNARKLVEAAGGITGLTTVPALTTADAKTAFETAQRVSAGFRPAPG